MKKLLLIIAALLCLVTQARAQSTYTPPTCNQSDVNAYINGPTHTVINGDVIQLPSGNCSWTSAGIIGPAGVGFSILGNGTPNSGAATTGANASCTATQITWTISSSHWISLSPNASASNIRISCIELITTGSTSSAAYPLWSQGTCNMSGCPSIRFDNLTIPTGSACKISDSSFAGIDDMFGVADHNNVGDVQSVCNGIDFVNQTYSAWQGVGTWGDNSWAQPDTFGTGQAFYLENNSFLYAFGTDVDYGNGGAGRFVCRFNTFDNVTPGGGCTNHGTESTGRARGGRQMEAYNNSLTCRNTSQGCSSAFGNRSGVSYIFDNTFTAVTSSWFNYYTLMTDYRTYAGVGTQFDGWGECNGVGNYDTNDGTTYYSGTYTGAGGATFVDAAQTWTATFGNASWASLAATAGNPYSLYDVTQGFGAQIGSSSGSSLTFVNFPICNWAAQTACSFNTGDVYQILRATVCLDQPARSGGTLLSGSPSASPTTPNGQTLDQDYEWGDTHTGSLTQAASGSQVKQLIRNRDFYFESTNQAAQTTSTSPFDGSTVIGMGHGTLANRPTNCTKGVGYWATDQGNWNTVGASGVLDQCTATNTWAVYYTPYVYPHPLDGGNSPAATPTPSPSGGSYSSTQSVTLSTSSGSVICYNLTGAPATNGTTGCTTGTLYTGAISINSTSTLYYVAGGTGLSDSAIGNSVYTITAPSGNSTTSGTTYSGTKLP